MDSNTPTAPVATAAVPPAQTAEELAAKVAELEKQSEGRLRDLQEERRKRQELEQKFNPPVPPTEPQKGVEDELQKVLNPYLKPVEERAKRAEAYMAQVQKDKAFEFLAQKTGKSKEAVLADSELDDRLTKIVNKYQLVGDVYSVTQRAWEIIELENLRNQDAERRRQEQAASQGSSIPSGTHTPHRASTKVYSEEDFSAMNVHEYEELANKGTFFQKKNGDIEYTPHTK